MFSSIPGVAEGLGHLPDVALDVITDPALGGYGGTVTFAADALAPATLARLAEAEVLIAEPAVVASLLRHDGACLRGLRWCQSTYAGVDALFATGASGTVPPRQPRRRPSWVLTRFAGCFGPPIAEWCLARIVGHERSFAATATDQAGRGWASSRAQVTAYRYLSTLTLTVLGCGDIGRRVAGAASALGMRTVGYGRKERSARDAGVDEYTQDLAKALRAGDYVVSVLPSTPETRGLLSGEALAPAAKANGGKGPVLLNVGRGDVISEASIISSLDRGYLSAAILDVFETEPLPSDSPLWDRPDVIVSPHVSALTQASDVPRVFLDNYERYVEGKDLKYVVDWDKGY